MCATVSCVSVHSPTCAPRRAAAYAASHPACPAPITMTSKFFSSHHRALATPEGTAEHAQQSIFITRTLPRVLSPRRHENTKTPRRRSVCHGQKQPRRPQSTRSRRRENILCGLCDLRGSFSRAHCHRYPHHEGTKFSRRKQTTTTGSNRGARRARGADTNKNSLRCLRSLRSPRFLLTRKLPRVP